jgi:hypothetical protein
VVKPTLAAGLMSRRLGYDGSERVGALLEMCPDWPGRFVAPFSS